MNLHLPTLNLNEKVIVAGIALNHFSFWPTVSIGDTGGSGVELAMLSGLLIAGYAIKNYYNELYNFMMKHKYIFFLIAWFAYGSILTLFKTSEHGINILRIGYLGSMLFTYLSVFFLLKTKKAKLLPILKGWVYLAIGLSFVVIAQFLAAAFSDLGLIKDSYAVGVFSFPRAHGFAFEPLFFANWLILPVLYSLYSLKERYSIQIELTTLLIITALMLTLSRGAFYGLVAATVCLVAYRFSVASTKRLFRPVLAGSVVALLLIGVSSSVNNSTFSNGIGRYLDHATLGVFNREGANNVEATVVKDGDDEQRKSFVNITGIDNQGVVEGSTKGRLEANGAAKQIFTDSPANALLGVGLFRFGEEAHERDPEIFTSTKQLSNNQLLDVVIETGLVGLALIAGFVFFAFKKLGRVQPLVAFSVVALLVQFLTFSGYFLIPFWATLAFLLGSSNKEVIK